MTWLLGLVVLYLLWWIALSLNRLVTNSAAIARALHEIKTSRDN